MISYIRGELAAVEEDRIVVEAGGIGYGILCPAVPSDDFLPSAAR